MTSPRRRQRKTMASRDLTNVKSAKHLIISHVFIFPHRALVEVRRFMECPIFEKVCCLERSKFCVCVCMLRQNTNNTNNIFSKLFRNHLSHILSLKISKNPRRFFLTHPKIQKNIQSTHSPFTQKWTTLPLRNYKV